MTTIRTSTTVGPDGVLHLALPPSADAANRYVDVTVEIVDRPPVTREGWHEFLATVAGSIDDPTFERPPRGE